MTVQQRIVTSLIVASAASVAFIVAYAVRAGPRAEGIAFAVSAAALCYAAASWALLLPRQRVTDAIEAYPSPQTERRAEERTVETDVALVTRPRALRRWLSVAVALFAASVIVPLRSLGPAPGSTLFGTRWRRGDRVCREDGTPVRAEQLNVDSVVTVFPEGAVGDSQSAAVLIRLPPDVQPRLRGYIAYSRICTHAGCPVALYRAAAKQLLCPCHQSVFDVTRNGAVVSGPADHALPRLPLVIDANGYVRATGDFPEAVGPGFWERA